MLHGLKMKDGQATYVARYIRTSRLQQEESFGAPKFNKLGNMRGVSGIMYVMLEKLRIKLGVLDVSNGNQTGCYAILQSLLTMHLCSRL
jgi:carotenoid cleavage dioxygenase-like enzyme